MSSSDNWENVRYSEPKRPPRRRKPNQPIPGTTTIEFPEPEIDDPEYLELLKAYDDTDSDDDNGKAEFENNNPRPRRKGGAMTQGAVYFLIIACVGLFILCVNYYNMKQLEQLKEEYGLDAKKPEPELWWKRALIYRLYVRSFGDSDGDGVGDLNGIRKHIDHIHYMRVDAVMLSPIFESAMVDYGKDVTNFLGVDPIYGTMDDFETLLRELHDLGIKVILEIVPNHTSKRHKWFRQSRLGGKDNKYGNFYMWHPGKRSGNGTHSPPNNWISRYGGSAWTWEEQRQQYYYHYYHSSMPDLNHRDPSLREEIVNILSFWMEKGVDGFLFDGVHALFENEDVGLDEPYVDKDGDSPLQPIEHGYLEHVLTEDQPEIHEHIATWRECMDRYSLKLKKKITMLVSVEDEVLNDVAKYYFTGADAPLANALTNLPSNFGGPEIHEVLDDWMGQLPTELDGIWMLSNPDRMRGVRHKGSRYQEVLNMLIMLLPGTAITYYGEEIGLQELALSYEDSKDIFARNIGKDLYHKYTRDPVRAPMPWTSAKHGGFTDGAAPWLPLHPSFTEKNVERQRTDSSSSSSLQLYQRLASLRKQPSFQNGKLQYSTINDNVLSYMRFEKDQAPYLVAVNVGHGESTMDYTLSAGVLYGKVVAHAKGTSSTEGIAEGAKLNLEKLTLQPAEGVVVLLLME